MATRGERFRAAAERSGPKREAKGKGKGKAGKRGTKAASNAGPGAGPGEAGRTLSARAKSLVSAEGPESARRYGGMSTAARNKHKPDEGRGKAGKGIYVLEDSRADGPPSRKSTRKSKAHVKSGTTLTTRTQLLASSPQRRHATRT